MFREFNRICRPGGFIMITNSVSHPKQNYLDCGREAQVGSARRDFTCRST
jgi:hypothetical protein